MPLDQHIEGGHRERQARLKIRPAPMHRLFEMADQRLEYPRIFSTDLDNLICESQSGEKGKWDANGERRVSSPRMPRTSISGFLTISETISITYVFTFVCCFPP